MKIFLVSVRIVLYYAAVISPLLSPAVAAGYDAPGTVLWFIIIPAVSVLSFAAAFSLFSPVNRKGFKGKISRYLIPFAVVLPFLFLPVPGFSSLFPRALLITIIILALNILIFRFRVISLSFIEPCFIFFIYYRLLDFSRSSETAAELSETIIPLFFVLLVVSYLIISMLLYFSSGNGLFKDIRKEAFVLVAVIAPLLAGLALLKPADYIVTDFIFNFRDEKALKSGGAGDADGAENGVSGVPAERWGSRSRGTASGRQYAVMIAASEEFDLYSAWEYLDFLDPVKGFYKAPFGMLNTLKNQRFLETWKNLEADYYSVPKGTRKEVDAFYISTTGERVVPYLPWIIEPTIYSNISYPFSYSYNTVSLVSKADLFFLERYLIEDLDDYEKKYLEEYLYADISDRHIDVFMDFIEKNDLLSLPYSLRIPQLLKSFSEYQYELGYDEDMSVEKLAGFIAGSFTGDCSEFSNAAALVGRLSGIPSRVARGYLASENLQTPNHKQALQILKQSIQRIKDIPLQNLKLVTTAHKHSWVQFYIPGFGWTDFEATEFAIPPVDGDPNAGQIVIPIIRELTSRGKEYIFPWRLLLSVFIFMLILFTFIMYLFKAVKLAYLKIMQKAAGDRSFKYRYRYILHRFFLLGYPLKKKTMTPVQYGEINNSALYFTELYTQLLYREKYSDDEKETALESFDSEYKKLLKLTKPAGVKQRAVYIFSFRGIYY